MLSEGLKQRVSSFVLDASALIAFLFDEVGADRVQQAIEDSALINSVNLAEVASKLVDFGYDDSNIKPTLAIANLTVVDLDTDLAIGIGLLRRLTRSVGLSLGDRACLALAQSLELPALTADRNWANLNLGIEIELCR